MTHRPTAAVRVLLTLALLGALATAVLVGQAMGENSVEVDNQPLLDGRANNCRTGALAALGQLDGEGVDQLLDLDPALALAAVEDLSILPDACTVDGVEVPSWIEPTLTVAADAARAQIAASSP